MATFRDSEQPNHVIVTGRYNELDLDVTVTHEGPSTERERLGRSEFTAEGTFTYRKRVFAVRCYGDMGTEFRGVSFDALYAWEGSEMWSGPNASHTIRSRAYRAMIEAVTETWTPETVAAGELARFRSQLRQAERELADANEAVAKAEGNIAALTAEIEARTGTKEGER